MRMSTLRKLNARRGKRGKQFGHTPANMTNPFDVYSEVLYKLQHIIHTLWKTEKEDEGCEKDGCHLLKEQQPLVLHSDK
jgi:hypothetical protein